MNSEMKEENTSSINYFTGFLKKKENVCKGIGEALWLAVKPQVTGD